ncbi:MAG: hypothetical protein A2152_04095 [Candidatus Levybacteria bacterium RBG_16_35_6]|nr:MAG: hypothetical protein A2152_04095 [Candidatus Levybacteria bacterium RBG_16_35_6]
MKEKKCKCWSGGTGGAIYGLGFIGAAVYFIQRAPDFWMGVVGVIKAIFWPAFLVYKALELLNF